MGFGSIKYAFDKFLLSTDRHELSADDMPIAVEPQVFDVLALLISQRDQVVSRDELVETIWQGRIVSDAALSSRIRDARTALGDSGARQVYIRTLHGRGFRFVGEVTSDTATAPASPTELAPVADSPSIAVLPFKSLSEEDDQDYFVDGICEDIINDLSRLKWQFVIARNSTYTYMGTQTEAHIIAKELGVRYLLDGGIRRDGDRVRVMVELLDGEAANPIWTERFDR